MHNPIATLVAFEEAAEDAGEDDANEVEDQLIPDALRRKTLKKAYLFLDCCWEPARMLLPLSPPPFSASSLLLLGTILVLSRCIQYRLLY